MGYIYLLNYNGIPLWKTCINWAHIILIKIYILQRHNIATIVIFLTRQTCIFSIPPYTQFDLQVDLIYNYCFAKKLTIAVCSRSLSPPALARWYTKGTQKAVAHLAGRIMSHPERKPSRGPLWTERWSGRSAARLVSPSSWNSRSAQNGNKRPP